VRKLVLEVTRRERMSVTVVFDGPPPPGSPEKETLGAVGVIYSGSASADDVIISRLPKGNAARQWVGVTDDRGLSGRVKQRGASVRRLAEWGDRPKARPKRARAESKLSSNEVADWEAYFQRDTD
jgi:uncharacterized protein YaiI (UPF0178 family)